MQSRAFWILSGGLLAASVAGAGFVSLRAAAEAEARARIEREARRLGLATTLGSVRLTPWLTLELRDLVLENAGRVRVLTRGATVRPALSLPGIFGRAAVVSLETAVLELPGGVRLEVQPSTWAVESASAGLRVHGTRPGERLAVELRRGSGIVELGAHAEDVHLSEQVRILVHGCRIADGDAPKPGRGAARRRRTGWCRCARRGRRTAPPGGGDR